MTECDLISSSLNKKLGVERKSLREQLHEATRNKILSDGKAFFETTMSISDFVKRHNCINEDLSQLTIVLSGMTDNVQLLDKEMFTFDLIGYCGGKVQVVARELDMAKLDFAILRSCVQPRFIVGITGYPGKCDRGNLSIFARCFDFYKKGWAPPIACVDPLECPGRHHLLTVMRNKESRTIIQTRYNIFESIRKCLSNLDSVESQLIKNTLEQLIENRINVQYNPKFSKFEFLADFDVIGLINLTETVLSGMVKDVSDSYKIDYHLNGTGSDQLLIDFTPPFRKFNILPSGLCGDKCPFDACTYSEGGQNSQPLSWDKVVGMCSSPFFVIGSSYFKLYINKHEVCSGYKNVLGAQCGTSLEPLKEAESGHEEAVASDHRPETGAWCIKFDYLTMLLTGKQNIEEVNVYLL